MNSIEKFRNNKEIDEEKKSIISINNNCDNKKVQNFKITDSIKNEEAQYLFSE